MKKYIIVISIILVTIFFFSVSNADVIEPLEETAINDEYGNSLVPYDYEANGYEIFKNLRFMIPYKLVVQGVEIPEKSIIYYRQYGEYIGYNHIIHTEFVYEDKNIVVPLSEENDILFCINNFCRCSINCNIYII